MRIINSYIFLPKEDEIKKDKDNNLQITLKDSPPTIINNLFNATDSDILLGELEEGNDVIEERLQDIFYKVIKGKFKLTISDKIKEIHYKFIEVNTIYYLDIIVDCKRKNIAVFYLEFINKMISEDYKNLFNNYIVIQSYDFVSEYYCNKIYPKLNSFERKLRKLLYLIYTSQFEKEYFKKTTSEQLQIKVKKNLQTKSDNKKARELDRIKNFFYSLDFGTLQEFLFEKRWTELEEIYVSDFLEENDDLSRLSDEKLRAMISNIRPKSDWERFFKDKNISESIEETINDIGKLRNIVAHNKLFNRFQFDYLNKLLRETEKTIDQAIVITETKDFVSINMEKIEKSIRNIRKRYSEFLKQITQPLLSSIKEIVNFNEKNK